MNTTIKKTTISQFVTGAFLALALQSTQAIKAQSHGDDSLHCLRIEGKILSDSKEGNCLVELYNNCRVIDSVRLEKGKSKFCFFLQRNRNYTIKISQSEHVVKLVSVETNLPVEIDGIYRFRFTTRLITEKLAKRMNTDALDFPVAIIYFDEKYKCFEFHQEYTSNIKREWYRLKTDELLTAKN